MPEYATHHEYGQPRPSTGLLRVRVKIDGSAFNKAMEQMRAFDETMRSITDTLRLWPETIELIAMPWRWPSFANYRCRPYDQEIDD